MRRRRCRTSPRPSVIPKAEAFAQVLSADGEVLEASPRALLEHPLLGPRQLAEGAEEAVHPRTRRAATCEQRTPAGRFGAARERAGHRGRRVVARRARACAGSARADARDRAARARRDRHRRRLVHRRCRAPADALDGLGGGRVVDRPARPALGTGTHRARRARQPPERHAGADRGGARPRARLPRRREP